MKKFQILNENNVPMFINDLDAEIAKFWGKEVGTEYVHPFEEDKSGSFKATMDNAMTQQMFNWHNVIGMCISNMDEYDLSWHAIAKMVMHEAVMSAMLPKEDGKIKLIDIQLTEQTTDENAVLYSPDNEFLFLQYICKKYRPFIDLINYFSEKGYKPAHSK